MVVQDPGAGVVDVTGGGQENDVLLTGEAPQVRDRI
jgi:hypothetical protein